MPKVFSRQPQTSNRNFRFDLPAGDRVISAGAIPMLPAAQHVRTVTCGGPLVLSATDSKIISTIPPIGGGDEDWYKPGRRPLLFYVNKNKTTIRLTFPVTACYLSRPRAP